MFVGDAIALSTREETIVRKYLVVGLVLMLSAVLAVPASANPPFVFTESGDPFPETNPCSGEEMLVTIDVVVSIHEHLNNFVVTVKRSGTTNDGFVMVNGTETFVDNGHVARGTFTDIWRNDAGDRFRASGRFVFNINTETLQFDVFSLTCLGNT